MYKGRSKQAYSLLNVKLSMLKEPLSGSEDLSCDSDHKYKIKRSSQTKMKLDVDHVDWPITFLKDVVNAVKRYKLPSYFHFTCRPNAIFLL